MNKITTRRGDKGQTDLLDHQRVNKTDCRIEANGEIDELMALLGMLKAKPELPESMRIKIEHIQMMLMQAARRRREREDLRRRDRRARGDHRPARRERPCG